VLKVLILRFSSIGDIVLTTPVLRCLKLQREDVELHFATKARFAELLQYNPYIDKLHLLDNSTHELIDQLHEEKFDLIVDLHNNVRTGRIKLALGVKSHTVHKLNFKKWLLVRFKINVLPELHLVERYMKTLTGLGVHYDDKGLDFYMDPQTLLPEDLSDKLSNSDYVVYAAGGTHATKRLPVHKMRELVENVNDPLIIIGGKEDKNRADEAISGLKLNVINACGELTIMQSALLMKGARLVISHDTGMMHIAAAFHKKLISIWGNTVPDFGMWPLYPADQTLGNHLELEVSALDCRPCSKLGYDQCPKGHFDCMNQQNLTKIGEKL
jgi:heptosyltransferase-2